MMKRKSNNGAGGKRRNNKKRSKKSNLLVFILSITIFYRLVVSKEGREEFYDETFEKRATSKSV